METLKEEIKGVNVRNGELKTVGVIDILLPEFNSIINHENIKRYGTGEKIKVKKYDFRRPDKFSKDQIRTLQMMHETFARLTATSLSAQLRLAASLHVVSVDQLTYSEFTNAISNPTTLAIVNMHPIKGTSIFEFSPSITFAIVDRLFGGKGETTKINRELTDIELSIMEGIIVRVLGNLRESWSTVIDLQPRLGNIETNPQFAQIVPPNDMVVTITFETKLGDAEGMINLCIPYMTIEPIMHKLSAQYWYTAGLKNGPTLSETSTVKSMKTNAEVFIEGDRLSAKNILHLKKNDLIGLPGYNNGEAYLLSGGMPILKLKKNEKTKTGETLFSVDKSGQLSASDVDIILPRESAAKNELENQIRAPLEKFASLIDKNINSLNQRITDIARKQDELTEHLYLSNNQPLEVDANQQQNMRPFNFISSKDTETLRVFIINEHPQTIALVLSWLEPNLKVDIMSGFDEALQIEVTRRIAIIDRTHPEVLKILERLLEKKLNTTRENVVYCVGGIKDVVEMLNLSSRSMEKAIIEGLEKKDPDLAESIKKNMFVFEDIVLLEDMAVKKLIEKIDMNDLSMALKAVDAEVQNHFFKNMPDSEVKRVKSEMAGKGPLRLRDVESAQQRIVNTIRMMEESGEIIVSRADELIVK